MNAYQTEPKTMTLTLTQPVSQHNGIKRAEVELTKDCDAQEVSEAFRILMKAMTYGDEIIRDILPTEDDYDKLVTEIKDEVEEEWYAGSEPPVDERWVLGWWKDQKPEHEWGIVQYDFNSEANINDDSHKWYDGVFQTLRPPTKWRYIDAPDAY